MTFEEWLVENGWVNELEDAEDTYWLEGQFSASELEELYREYEAEGWCGI